MKAIEIISIPVTDQQRSKEFYQKLGFNVLVEAPFDGGQKWVQMGFPGDGPSITLVTWFRNMPPGCINGFVIKTDDVEKEAADLVANGIAIGKIDGTPWGKFLSVKDPDGNALSFHQG
jgi:catechol 2,3-dioxygenase-like lactoylglutathione lyase family enzyme